MKRIAIIGSALAGGAGQIIEAMQSSISQKPIFILDRDPDIIDKTIFGIPVLGPVDEVFERWAKGEFDEAIIAIGGDLTERKRLFDLLTSKGIAFGNIIDPTVKLGLDVKIGTGNVILNNCYLGNKVILGNNNYFLNQCSLQHDTETGDHNYFATNVTVGAKVTIGSLNRFNIKCVLETKAKVENNSSIGIQEVIKAKK
jgi:acetyltransferase-like isoleucine patch superfamily enzyme